MRKNILDIKQKLELKLSENKNIYDMEYNDSMMMTSSLNHLNRILFSSVHERLVIDVEAVLVKAISYLEDE